MRVNTYHDILIKHLRSKPKLGKQSIDPEERQKEINNKLQNLSERIPKLSALYDTYKTILKGVATEEVNLSQGLGQVITYQKNYQTQIESLYKSMTALEQANKDLSKEFGLNAKNGAILAKAIRGLSTESGVGEDKLFEYAKSLRSLTGGMLTAKNITTTYGKALVNARQIMITNLGVSEDAADGYELMAAGMGKSGLQLLSNQSKLAAAIGKKTGLDSMAIQRDLTEEIGNLTADLQMRYDKIPGSLELAVLKSKALGLSMRDLASTGDNLLNIESSIGTELEYQLLSGKRLLVDGKKSLTDAYRRATIEGDADEQARLINHLLEDQGEILQKNMFARKKASELLGIDESVLAKSIQKREALVKLGAEELMNLKADDFEAALSKLETEIGNDVDRKKIFEELKKATDTRSTDEQALDVLKVIETNTKLSAGVDVAKVQEQLLAEIKRGDRQSFQGLITAFNNMDTMKLVGEYKNISGVATAIENPLSLLATQLPVIGDVLKTTLELLKKLTIGTTATQIGQSARDAVFMNDGLIQLHQDDKLMRVNDSTMIAGTNVGGMRDFARAANNSSIDYNKMAQAIAAAMQNVKVEANVKTDNLYAATKLNGPTRFG